MRNAAVAGQFYPGSSSELKKQIEECFLSPLGPGKLPGKNDLERDIIGGVVPHAGYMYSGFQAAHVYYRLSLQKKPELVVILGPNHTGIGTVASVSLEDWHTPLGKVEVDRELAEKSVEECDILELDEMGHQYEHSIEVQLPFLQYIYDDFKILPISMGKQDLDVASKIASYLSEIEEDVLILSSSDFTHYESIQSASQKDNKAIKHILDFNAMKFVQFVYENNATICGYGPIAANILASKGRGASKAELLKYGTSGDVTGDMTQVVAYAGIVFRK